MDSIPGSHVICRVLLEQGARVIFGYPGGAIMPFYHALPEFPDLRHVLVRHEQSAAHAADGWARATGMPGVCVATSGPGATNLVTGLATAMMDGVPLVAITGQVPRSVMGRDAFQETDIVGIALPITKHCVLVEEAEQLAPALRQAFAVAREGRPGPVLVDIPKDLQNERMAYQPPSPERRKAPPFPDEPQFALAARLIARAERPLIVAGHGVLQSGAMDELRRFAERGGIPVITTLLGIGVIPHDHPLHLGMPGMHGEVHVNRAIQRADLLIAIGMRFDDRVTGNTAGFARHAKVIHIDLDATEIGKNITAHAPLPGDARAVLLQLLELAAPRDCAAWREEIARGKRPVVDQWRGGLSAEAILRAIDRASGDGARVVADVGQHQMWVAKLFPHRMPGGHFSSGGLGTMGYSVPAAMGVQLACPGDAVWAIAGDGGIQMCLPELATMVQEGIPVKVAVFNNGYLGMVRQWQQFFHGRRYSGTPIWSPDYVKLAAAYGIAGWRVESAGDIAPAVEGALATDGPALVEFMIEQEANVYPMVPPGATLSEAIESEPASAAV